MSTGPNYRRGTKTFRRVGAGKCSIPRCPTCHPEKAAGTPTRAEVRALLNERDQREDPHDE